MHACVRAFECVFQGTLPKGSGVRDLLDHARRREGGELAGAAQGFGGLPVSRSGYGVDKSAPAVERPAQITARWTILPKRHENQKE